MTLRPYAGLAGANTLDTTTAGVFVAASGPGRSVTLISDPPVTSATLSGEPGCMLAALSALWVITTNGRLIKLSPTTLAVSYDADIGATNARWITATSSVIVTPGAPGGIQVYNTSGTRLSRADSIFDRVEYAIVSGSYLYVFDGAGTGAVMTVSSAGVIVRLENFSVPNVRGIVRAKVYGTSLYLAGQSRESVCVLSLATATAPTVTSTTPADAGALFSVTDDSAATPVGTIQQTAFGLKQWFASTDADYSTGGYTVLHGNSGRASTIEWPIWNPVQLVTPGGPTLSNGNRTARVLVNTNVRSTTGHLTGKHYAEITITQLDNAGFGPVIGILVAGEALTETLGSGASTYHSVGWEAGTSGGTMAIGPSPGGNVGAYGAGTTIVGTIISVLLDSTNKLLTFWRDGVSLGTVVFAPYTVVGNDTYLLAMASGTYGFTATGNFGYSPFTYTMPAGYSPWGVP